MLAFLDNIWGESVGYVVKGVDKLSLQGARWLRVESESAVTNVLEDVLG